MVAASYETSRRRKAIELYLITNTVNDKIYIGKTSRTAERRWKEHVKDANRGSNRILSNAIRKYGTKSFRLEILETKRAKRAK